MSVLLGGVRNRLLRRNCSIRIGKRCPARNPDTAAGLLADLRTQCCTRQPYLRIKVLTRRCGHLTLCRDAGTRIHLTSIPRRTADADVYMAGLKRCHPVSPSQPAGQHADAGLALLNMVVLVLWVAFGFTRYLAPLWRSILPLKNYVPFNVQLRTGTGEPNCSTVATAISSSFAAPVIRM
jgi:hypothetical protein